MNANIRLLTPSLLMRPLSVYALCAILATPALARQDDDAAGDVNVTDYGRVDITVRDTDLTQVLEMLAIQSKKNIIVSKSVSGTVSANLYDVTLYEALNAILNVNGYAYYEEGNFIYVITKEEAKQIEDSRRKTETRVFELNYLSGSDASELIAPMLSEKGKSSFRGDVIAGFKPDVGEGGADTYAYNARLIVNDYAEVLDMIATNLNELDVPPSQVLVESTILQTSLDEANAFGVDFTVLGDVNFTDLVSPLSAVNNLLGGSDPTNGFQPTDNKAQALSSTPGNTSGPANLKIGVVSDDISVFLRVLDEVTDSTVLARPKVMALNRQRAQVLVGARIGYLSTTATETTTTQTVEFLDTGIELVFRPFISKDGSIRLELSPSVSEASLRTVTDSNGLIVTIPDELTNELTTNVRIKDGQTLVLGGLFKESMRTTRRQVPILGDIPILGAPFRGHDDAVERNEIIFLITPSIVQDETLWEYGKDALAWVDSARVGARDGLLLFSREKVSLGYNQDAMEAYANGDNDKALHYIHKSLRLNPAQPEMIEFRAKITGEKERVHDRGLLERAIRKELGPIAPTASNTTATPSWSTASSSWNTNDDMTSWNNATSETHSTAAEFLAGFDSTTPTMDDNGMISLSVSDQELSSVLEMLSIQSNTPIMITNSDVTGPVTAQLTNVTLAQALDSILAPQGFGWYTQDDAIHVTTADEVAEHMTATVDDSIFFNESGADYGTSDTSSDSSDSSGSYEGSSENWDSSTSDWSTGETGSADTTTGEVEPKVSSIDNDALTPEQRVFYQKLVAQFFNNLGMPEMSPYDVQTLSANTPVSTTESQFPFETFDSMMGVVTATDESR